MYASRYDAAPSLCKNENQEKILCRPKRKRLQIHEYRSECVRESQTQERGVMCSFLGVVIIHGFVHIRIVALLYSEKIFPDFLCFQTLIVLLTAHSGFCAKHTIRRRLVPRFSHSFNRPSSAQMLSPVCPSGMTIDS